MKRKPFTQNIDPKIKKAFERYVDKNDLRSGRVLEEAIATYLKGKGENVKTS